MARKLQEFARKNAAKIIGIFVIPRIVCFHPVNLFLQLKLKVLQKRLQKQRIKREYIKARKKAASAKTAEQALKLQTGKLQISGVNLLRLA